jgi:hypothetical protein
MENNHHRWCDSSDFLYPDNDRHADVYLLCIRLLTWECRRSVHHRVPGMGAAGAYNTLNLYGRHSYFLSEVSVFTCPEGGISLFLYRIRNTVNE